MNLKNIVSKTINFILIVGFIIIFKSIFGDENTLIGVTTITGMLLLLGKDLTLEPWKNTSILILFNVLLGIFSYISQNNMYLGILFNFMAIFITAFRLSYNLKAPAYLPFTLQYLFMLATPVTPERFPMRLLSLVFGAVAIMVTQFVANRGRIKKYGNKILEGVCTLILHKMKAINNGEDTTELNRQIVNSIYSFKKIVYDKRKKSFYLTEEGHIKLNLCLALGKLNLLINELKEDNLSKEVLKDITGIIEHIKNGFENKENLTELENILEDILTKYKETDFESIALLKSIDVMILIKESLYRLQHLRDSDYDNTKDKVSIPKKFSVLTVYKNEFNLSSIRFTFAARFAIGVVIGAFISDFFNLSEGRWIYFTIAALSQPQYEMSKQKGKDRLFATTIGIIIVGIAFTIITNETLRALIIMGAGYTGSYLKQYRYNMICTTVSAVGSASLLGSAVVFSFTRLWFVILGSIIAIILARFVLPYKLSDANKVLVKKYKQSLGEMLYEIKYLVKGEGNDDSIKNLILATSLIEDKLITNNSSSNNEELDLLIEEGRRTALNIFELYEWIRKAKVNKDELLDIIVDISNGIRKSGDTKITSEKKLIHMLNETKDIKEKITITNIIEVFAGLNKIKAMKIKF